MWSRFNLGKQSLGEINVFFFFFFLGGCKRKILLYRETKQAKLAQPFLLNYRSKTKRTANPRSKELKKLQARDHLIRE